MASQEPLALGSHPLEVQMLIIQASTLVRQAAEHIDRLDDGCLHMALQLEGRMKSLEQCTYAIDALERCKQTLSQIPLYQSQG